MRTSFLHRSLVLPLEYWLLAVLLLSSCYLDSPSATPVAVSEFLVGLLKDPDPEVRRTAAEALGKVGHSLRAHDVAQTVSDIDPRVREAGVIALGRLAVQADSAEVLVHALADTAPLVSRAAARSLGELDVLPAEGAGLVRLLKDPDTMKRRAAIQALLQVETPNALSDVALAVQDADAEVRQGAVAALGEWWGARSIPLLRERLAHDAVAGVRAEAAYRLGKIGNEDVVRELHHVARTDRDAAVRRWAAWASDQLTAPSGSG